MVSRERVRQGIGCVLLGLVVSIWVGSSYLMQAIYSSDYNKPWFVTYMASSLFSVYLSGFLFRPSWRRILSSTPPTPPSPSTTPPSPSTTPPSSPSHLDTHDDDAAIALLPSSPSTTTPPINTSSTHSHAQPPLPPLTWKEIVKVSGIVAFLWFGANYSFNAALTLTSVSSNTILSSTSGVWTFGLGYAVGVESGSWAKATAVALVLGGVVLVALSDDAGSEGKDSFVGDGLSLLSALGYGAYVVYLKSALHDESRVSMPMLFGCVGAWVALCGWPLGFILDLTGAETLALPDAKVWVLLAINSLVGTVLSDLIWLYAVMLTTPLIATIGLSLTIPLAMTTQALFTSDADFTGWYVTGALLVVAGFVVVNVDDLLTSGALRIPGCPPRTGR